VRPRTSIEDLVLQGSSKLNTALKRDEDEALNPRSLSEKQRIEIAELDKLIAQAMKACAHGSTFKGKRNPAFQNLKDLVYTRKQIMNGNPPDLKKSNAELLEEIDALTN
jgi:hypothetical protein